MTQEVSPQQNTESEYMSARQRAKKCRSGENAARLLMGLDLEMDDAERRKHAGRCHSNAPRNSFSSPREFFAGPTKPPHRCSGIRHNPDGNRDSVGFMLKDEYFMMNPEIDKFQSRRLRARMVRNGSPCRYGSISGMGAYGIQARRGEGSLRQNKTLKMARMNGSPWGTGSYHCRDGLTNNCIVTAPEVPWRCGVRITHPQGAMEAPYFEDNDPRPPRDVPAVTGKRHVKPPYKDAKMFGQVPPPAEGEEDEFHSILPPCHKTSNKANESVDVLNLYCYTADELNEKPQPYKQLGPRKCGAPELPPKKPPVIKHIDTPARQEHDVLGTGRWGFPEKQVPRGLARGLCRPRHDTANLFYGGPAQEDDKLASGTPRESAGRNGGSNGAHLSPRQSHQGESYRSASRRSSSHGSRTSARPSRQVQPFRAHRNTPPKKREDPVFDSNFRPHKVVFKNVGNPNLLRYYDPTVDPMPEAMAPKRSAPRSNIESMLDDSNMPCAFGKGRGEFNKYSRSTITLV
ncbi:conserved hypothetical protein [Leishmania braziliensis MHOM/BR/75/M2904]|uniref:Flagellum targeting protein kharon1 n=2 Tax=Leishmania braziliensis TaxID=5660 RepID=A4HQA3_LEIBR|nr:conserved hypothetical protein [Leishmania braziliensis MHOM/BR/75/M2904]KAI5691642.1 hypothetical protein MNV84_08368 [Leishmania braziliensis]CAJ2482162.1 unnamed protein product [Leishmania braziliensis]CAM44368.1 conserved hypothetical protein [Leishmania braziliensis MHOM/BR/75/M2904]SYZ70441.1 flagellum_targeting_protein_kharon1 [Leishmania braziliensis MHOM/BR/75/M2904]